MPRLPHLPILLAMCVALPLAACSDDPADTASADDTIVTTTTTTEPEPELTAEQEVEAAYLEALRSHYARLQEPNPDDPLIADLYAGASYERVIARNRELVDNGQAVRLTARGIPAPSIRSVEMDSPNRATIVSCYVDDVVVYVRATDEIINDAISSVTFESVLVRESSRWKLTENLMVSKVSGPNGCSAA